MNSKKKWVGLAVTLLMMIGAGGLLSRLQGEQKLGAPGVKTAPLADSKNLEVLLPESVLDYTSEKVPIDQVVYNYLPADTSYGQRKYTAPDGFARSSRHTFGPLAPSSITAPRPPRSSSRAAPVTATRTGSSKRFGRGRRA